MKMITELKSEVLNGRDKFTDEEMTDAHIDAAKAYIIEYNSDFSFMLEMKNTLVKTNKLSAGQAKGVLNVMRAELLRAKEAELAKTIQIADGEYELGEWKFQLATQPTDADFAPGETIISYPGKKKPWLGFGFVRGRKLQAWSRFKDDAESQTMIAIAMLLIAGGKGAASAAA